MEHGGDTYGKTIKYDFSININPLGMPKECEKLLSDYSLKDAVLAYPDDECRKLRKMISQVENVPEEHILVGNGATELIYAFCRGFSVGKALVNNPTFSEYEKAAFLTGGGKKARFICNPNNPDGRLKSRDEVLEIIADSADYCLVDECFLPLCKGEEEITVKGLTGKYKNLFILRAFTKVYAMPGVRLGYLIGNPEDLAKIKNVMPTWSVSGIAQEMGIAALSSGKEYLEKSVCEIARLREDLEKQLNDLLCGAHGEARPEGGFVHTSEANFILFKGPDDLYEKMLDKGIMIRDCSNFKGLSKGYYRIAVKDEEANLSFVKALSEVLRY